MNRLFSSVSGVFRASSSSRTSDDRPPSYTEASGPTSHVDANLKDKEKEKLSSRYVYYEIHGASERVALVNPYDGPYVGRVNLADVAPPKRLAGVQRCIDELAGFDPSMVVVHLGPKAKEFERASSVSSEIFAPRTGYPGCNLDNLIIFVVKHVPFESTNFIPRMSQDMSSFVDQVYYSVFQDGKRTESASRSISYSPYVGFVSIKHMRPGANILCLKNRIGLAEGKQVIQIFQSGDSTTVLPDESTIHNKLGPPGNPLAVICQDTVSLISRWKAVNSNEWRTTAIDSHLSRIDCLAFSPNSTFVASASRDRTIRLWNAHSGKAVRTISYNTQSHANARANTLLWFPDGRKIALAFGNSTILVFDVGTGQKLLEIDSKHIGKKFCLAISPDGRFLASGGEDKVVRRFDASTGECVDPSWGGDCHPQSVNSLCYHPDGTHLASISGGLIRLLSADIHANLFSRRNAGSVHHAKFSRDGQLIASGSRDGYIHLWDPDLRDTRVEGEKFQHPPNDDDDKAIRTVSGISIAPDSSAILSIGSSNKIVMWDTSIFGEIDAFSGCTMEVSSKMSHNIDRPVEFAPDGRSFVICSRSDEMTIYSLPE